MAIIYPTASRAVIEMDAAMLCITIPVARAHSQAASPLVCLAVSVWVLALRIIALWRGESVDTGHIAVLLALCTASLGMTLWYFRGKEIIEIDATTLKRIRQVPFFRDVRKYSLAQIANLRPAADMKLPAWLPAQRLSCATFGGGRIAFDYGRRTHRLGIELSDADTARVLTATNERMSARATTDDQSREQAAG